MREIFDNLNLPTEETPTEKAKKASQLKLPKRFYKVVDIKQGHSGQQGKSVFYVLLDGQNVKTPAKKTLALPTKTLAHLVADEFALQVDIINPARMPTTRIVNTVIDGIAEDMQPVFEDILRFSATDMLFYRAAGPQKLVEWQAKHWDAILDWAAVTLGAQFHTVEGINYIEQPREAIAAIGVFLRQITSPFQLAALHMMTTLTGSVLIALATVKGELSPKKAWECAHLEEDWTIEHWGEDYEAKARRDSQQTDMLAAAAVFKAAHDDEKE